MAGVLVVRGQHPRRGAPAVDPQLSAGAFDQGVGPRLGDPHQRSDLLGQPMLADQPQRLALALGQQFDAGSGRRPVHDARGWFAANARRAARDARMHCGRPRPSRYFNIIVSASDQGLDHAHRPRPHRRRRRNPNPGPAPPSEDQPGRPGPGAGPDLPAGAEIRARDQSGLGLDAGAHRRQAADHGRQPGGRAHDRRARRGDADGAVDARRDRASAGLWPCHAQGAQGHAGHGQALVEPED